MGKYFDIEETFSEIWRELESVKERLYLLGNHDKLKLEIIDNISNTVYDAQQKVLDLEGKYLNHFEKELDAEEAEEDSE